MENIVDITIIATLRPEILSRTLDSFFKMVKYSGMFRAVVNIDCVPARENGISEIVEIITGKFKDYMLLVSKQPSFAKAVKTAWMNTKSDYVFHLEDDWIFAREIDIDWCVSEMASGGADYIRFSKRSKPIIEENNKIGLLPSLWRGKNVRKLSPYMSMQQDPEKQLRRGQGNEYLESFLPKKIIDYPGGLCSIDIGREWIEKPGLKKWDKNTGAEITWVKA